MFENLWVKATTLVGAVLIAGTCTVVVAPSVASAAAHTFKVNTTSDTHAAHSGTGVCADSFGHCSLRAAIDEGLAFIKANPDESREIEKKYLGFNSPHFPTFENKARPEDLKVFIAIGKELGLYRTALDPEKLVLP